MEFLSQLGLIPNLVGMKVPPLLQFDENEVRSSKSSTELESVVFFKDIAKVLVEQRWTTHRVREVSR